MPDATDSNALVPHRLEELFNVNTTAVSVGDVLTVTDMEGGTPVWEAAAATGGPSPWLRINLPYEEADWSQTSESGLATWDEDLENAPGVVTFEPGAGIRTAAFDAESELGVGLAQQARPYEVRYTFRTMRGMTPEGHEAPLGPIACLTTLVYDNVTRPVYWGWEYLGGSHQIVATNDLGSNATFWAPVAGTLWSTVEVTVSKVVTEGDMPPAGTMRVLEHPGSSPTVPFYGSQVSLVAEPPSDTFEVLFNNLDNTHPASHATPLLVDLANSFIDIRAI